MLGSERFKSTSCSLCGVSRRRAPSLRRSRFDPPTHRGAPLPPRLLFRGDGRVQEAAHMLLASVRESNKCVALPPDAASTSTLTSGVSNTRRGMSLWAPPTPRRVVRHEVLARHRERRTDRLRLYQYISVSFVFHVCWFMGFASGHASRLAASPSRGQRSSHHREDSGTVGVTGPSPLSVGLTEFIIGSDLMFASIASDRRVPVPRSRQSAPCTLR
eukprot:Selendium_serpulae@DN5744_c4_g1_i12.p1